MCPSANVMCHAPGDKAARYVSLRHQPTTTWSGTSPYQPDKPSPSRDRRSALCVAVVATCQPCRRSVPVFCYPLRPVCSRRRAQTCAPHNGLSPPLHYTGAVCGHCAWRTVRDAAVRSSPHEVRAGRYWRVHGTCAPSAGRWASSARRAPDACAAPLHVLRADGEPAAYYVRDDRTRCGGAVAVAIALLAGCKCSARQCGARTSCCTGVGRGEPLDFPPDLHTGTNARHSRNGITEGGRSWTERKRERRDRVAQEHTRCAHAGFFTPLRIGSR